MARIVFSGLIADGYGSVGGLTFSKNPAGNFVRTRVTPVRGRTYHTGVQRGAFATAARTWRTLSEANRISWNTFAPAGVSGFATYVAWYLNATKIGVTPPLSPPAAVAPTPALITSLTGTVGPHQLVLAMPNPIAVNNTGYIMMSMPVSPGQIFNKKTVIFIALITNASGPSINLWNAYTTRIGFTPLVGQQIWLQLEVLQNSSLQALPAIYANCIMS